MSTAPAAVVSLQDSAALPLAEIGERAVRLTNLLSHGLPLPTTLVIPTSSLTLLVAEHHLAEKWIDELAQLDWQSAGRVQQVSQNIQKQLGHLSPSKDFADDLLLQLQKWVEGEFVAVRPSFVSPDVYTTGWSQLHVRGEANIWQSILQIWQQAYAPENLALRWQELQHGHVTPSAILLQRMVPATSSGWMQLADPASSLPMVLVFSQWGLTPTRKVPRYHLDQFAFDLQNHVIHNQELGVKVTKAESRLDKIEYKQVAAAQQNLPSLNSVQLRQLGKYYQTIWYSQMVPPLVEWAAVGDELYILDVSAVEAAPLASPNSPTENLPVLPHLSLAPLVLLGDKSTEVEGSLAVFSSAQLHKQLGFTQETAHQAQKQSWWHDRLVQHLQPQSKALTLLYASEFLDPKQPSYRGALQLLHHPEVLDAEIDALATVHDQNPHHHHGIIIPFVRSISEWGMVERHIRHQATSNTYIPELWLELAVPANLAELHGYLHYRPDGVIINWPTFSTFSRGLETQDVDIMPFYAGDDSLLESVVMPAVQTLREHGIPTMLRVARASSLSVSRLQTWGLSAVIIESGIPHTLRGW